MRPARYLVVIAATTAMAACGETTLDTARLESEIARDVEEQTGTRDVEVDCPDDVEQEKGGRFECEATAPGGITAKVEATQTDDDGDVDWKLTRP